MSKYISWKDFERQIVRDLKSLGFEAKRTWDVQFEEGSGLDVVAENDKLSLAIQAKYGKKPNMKKAYLEAVGAKGKEQMAISVCRFSKERDTLVVLSWADFKKLLKK